MAASDPFLQALGGDLPEADAPPADSLFSRILVLVDGSSAAPAALDTAVRLARRDRAALALLAIVDTRLAGTGEAGIPTADLLASLRRAARARLLDLSLTLPAGLHADELVREGVPARAIVDAARDWRADLIVLGQAPRDPLARLLDGGAAVASDAPCPVLTVSAPAPATEPSTPWRPHREPRARSAAEPDCRASLPA